MNPDYIIVQAGGKGTRLRHLTRNKPKALVSIDNLPMLFHLFKKFPDKKYIIIADYKSDVMRKYLDAFAKVKYLVIDAKGKNGTCGGLAQAIDKLPSGEAFMLVWSDLILPEEFAFPEGFDNYIGLSKGFSCRWRYENGKFEEEPSDLTGVAGLFIFKDKSYIASVPGEGEFVRWLSNENIKFDTFGLQKTKEYGILSEYNKIADTQTGSRCRPFNSMRVEGGLLIKEGIDGQGRALAARERAWYKYAAEKGFDRVPKIYEYEPLKMQRINGRNIFEYDIGLDEKKKILTELIRALKKLHNLGRAAADHFSIYDAYIGKTFARLDKIRDLVPFADQREIVINGRKCRNVYFFKEEVKELFADYKCDRFEFLHGDNTFSNMMLDENLSPVFIDPRGYFGDTEFYGDPNYDWAKLYYSVVGNYDQFNLKRFELFINETDVELKIQSNGWEQTEELFFELLSQETKPHIIKLIHSIIWLSLTTYAWDDYDSVCGAFYNGLYYLEEAFEIYLTRDGMPN